MRARLSLVDFDAASDAFDGTVAATPGIVPYCSCSDWILAAHLKLMVERELRIFRDGNSWLVTARPPDHNPWQPLEAAWCFGCSLIGPDPVHSAGLLRQIMTSGDLDGHPIWISGIQRGSEQERALAGLGQAGFDLRARPSPLNAVTADLAHGMDDYFARRGANFRRNVRRAAKRSAADGVTFVDAGDDSHAEIMRRILAIDRRSYKHTEGKSIFADEAHRAFYTELLARASRQKRLLAMFARRKDVDIGYYIGARLAHHFRGLQMGYDNDFAHIGVGNALHLRVIEQLCEQGIVQYDLGMAIAYKEQWSDETMELVTVLVASGT